MVIERHQISDDQLLVLVQMSKLPLPFDTANLMSL